LAVRQASICSVFGNTKRVLILWALAERKMSVSDIAVAINASLQNTSQHLRLMEDRGILTSHREGHNIYYALAGHELMKNCGLLKFGDRVKRDENGDSQLTNFNPIINKKGINIMTTAELTAIEAAKVVDARGSACPGPLLEAKKGIGAIKKGEVLEIWSGDPKTKDDIPRWSKKVGHEFLGFLTAEGGYDRIFIKRMK
jgi:TusA-related sulfurtransferase/DNA-binding HxlR family transcriptional regulator